MTQCSNGETCRGKEAMQRDPVAEAIANARAALHVNQAGFAAMLGIKQPTVAQLESGKRKPSPGLAYRLAKLSGKPLETFVEEHYAKQNGRI